jgi:hypothetical protein
MWLDDRVQQSGESREEYARSIVAGWAERYEKTGKRDSFMPWFAYAVCRWANIPFPAWVLEYIDRAAESLWRVGWGAACCRACRVAAEMRSGRNRRQFAEAVTDALEMKRVYSPAAVDAEGIAEQIFRSLVRGDRSKPYLAIEDAAKDWGVSKEKARRAWKQSVFSRYNRSAFSERPVS